MATNPPAAPAASEDPPRRAVAAPLLAVAGILPSALVILTGPMIVGWLAGLLTDALGLALIPVESLGILPFGSDEQLAAAFVMALGVPLCLILLVPAIYAWAKRHKGRLRPLPLAVGIMLALLAAHLALIGPSLAALVAFVPVLVIGLPLILGQLLICRSELRRLR